MELRIGKEKIKISHNKNNTFWKPIGMFLNASEIKINDEWYSCGVKFIMKESKTYIQFTNPMKVDKRTSRIIEVYGKDIYNELLISKLKMNIVKYLLNKHPINYSIFNFKMAFRSRINFVIILSCSVIASTVFFLINQKYNNVLIDFIAKNIWCQTILMFLTIASFVNIFYPFSVRKELTRTDIQNISRKTIAEEEAEKIMQEKINKRATF